jgi:prepilin-type N-terminal cleavage/methylation domain-containing protein
MYFGRATTRRSTSAFTLIELLIVMVLIAIAFYAFRPNFAGVLRGAEKRGALRKVVGLLTSARSEAIARGTLIRVICSPREGLIWAEAQVDPTWDIYEFEPISLLGRPEVSLPQSLVIGEVWIAGQVAAGVGDATIYFYPDGRTDGASLVLVGEGGDETVIDVAPTTGRVRLNA